MKRLFVTFILLVITSCATSQEKKIKSWESWKGRPVADLDKHSYFRNLKVMKIINNQGLETWIFKDQTPFQSSAYCQSLGGCQGMTIYNCESAFSVKDDEILGFEQSGICPGIKTSEWQNK